MKKCTKCQIEKSKTDFSKDKNTTDGFRSQCKQCLKETYILNKDKISDVNKTNYNPEKKKEYYHLNTEKLNQKHKIYYQKNKDSLLLNKKLTYNKELKKEYHIKNKKRINKLSAERRSKRRKTDCIFRFKHNISSLIRNSIKKKGYTKSKKTEEIIGCTIDELIMHLSNMFLDGMSFENHGEWHIDHIIPLVTAKTEEEVIKLNHYTNLQPLWAIDNLSKGGKYNETFKD
jgi:hypothetical protein